jgi:hypothetical protein
MAKRKRTNAEMAVPLKPHQWKKGQSGNPNGRPRKWTSQLATDFGYTHGQVRACMRNMLAMEEDKLDEILKSTSSTALEKSVAKILKRAISVGDSFRLEQIITRPFGGPTQVVEEDVKIEVTFKEPPPRRT